MTQKSLAVTLLTTAALLRGRNGGFGSGGKCRCV